MAFICRVVSQKAYLNSRFPWQFWIHIFQTAILGWFSESKKYKISLYSQVQMNSVLTYFKTQIYRKNKKLETKIEYLVKNNLGESSHQKLLSITSVQMH